MGVCVDVSRLSQRTCEFFISVMASSVPVYFVTGIVFFFSRIPHHFPHFLFIYRFDRRRALASRYFVETQY